MGENISKKKGAGKKLWKKKKEESLKEIKQTKTIKNK